MNLNQSAQSIHGHEVMRLIAKNEEQGYTRSALAGDVAATFGDDARFHACAGDTMTLDELLVFLKGRGKVVETADGLKTDLGEMCSHGEGEH